MYDNYGGGQMYGGYGSYGGNGHITKTQVKQYFDMCIANTYGVPRVYVKLDDTSAPFIKHPCVAQKKLVMLNRQIVPVPELGMQLPYYVCTCCGKLYTCPDDFALY